MGAESWPALEEARQKVAVEAAAGNAGGGDPARGAPVQQMPPPPCWRWRCPCRHQSRRRGPTLGLRRPPTWAPPAAPRRRRLPIIPPQGGGAHPRRPPQRLEFCFPVSPPPQRRLVCVPSMRPCLLMDCGEGGGGEGWEAAVRAEVGAAWWDDPDGADLRVRFKAFTGQRRDWPQTKLLFWKDLLLRVARRLRLCSAPAHLVMSVWFARPGGLTPLCLPQVLEEMRADGEILLKSELIDPTSGSLYQLVRRVSQMAVVSRRPIVQGDILVFKSLVEERAADIVRQLSDSHWTSICVITISKFNSFFDGQEDAHAALCYLTQCGKARYFVARKQDPVEGVKFPLVASQAPAVSKLDYDTLHLVWAEEKLQQQLDVLDRRWEISRRMALVSFKSGDKQAAYRYVRQSKLFSESRNRCTPLLERVEEVISLIASAESTKKVYEAIQISIQAMKEHNVSIEEVYIHLKEVDDLVAAQRKVDAALESVPLQSLDGEEDIEEEFRKLEAELQDEIPHMQVGEPVSHANEESPDEVVESLSNNLSNIKLEAI